MAVTTEKRTGHHLPALPKKPANTVPRSAPERLWLIGGGTVALLLTVIAFFFFISPQRSETDDVRSQVADAAGQNSVLEHRLAQLREQNKNISRYESDLAAARKALPSTTDVSDFIRSLQSLGAQTGVDVASVTVGTPAPFTPAAVGATTPTAAASPSASASSSPAAGTATGSGATATAPAASGVYGMSISAQVSGSPADLTRFVDQLQNVQPRAVLITSLTETSAAAATGSNRSASPVAGNGSTTLALGMIAFVAPTASTAAPSTGSAK